MKSKNRYLVVLRAGDHSLHKQWLEPAAFKNFDLMIDYFGNQRDRHLQDADIYFETKGFKWPGIYSLLNRYGAQIFEYEAVWFPDEDLSTNAEKINEMFHLFTKFDLWLAQPALTRDSFHSHKITLVNPDHVLRYTNFVEVMAPVFSREALKRCMHTFNKSQSSWGLDFIWPKLLGYPENKVAIIDHTPVKHTRPVGRGLLYKILPVSPTREMRRVAGSYGVKLPYRFRKYGEVKKWWN